MFGSFLPHVVRRRSRVLFTLFVFVCLYWCPTHIVMCFCFVCLRFVYHMLTVSLDCPLLIAPPVFSNVYLILLIILLIVRNSYIKGRYDEYFNATS